MVKRILTGVGNAVLLFGAVYCLPLFLTVAFNYGKGIQNNEDGILFIPLGFLLVAAAVLAGVMSVRNVWKESRANPNGKWAGIAVLSAILILAVALSCSLWKEFVTCLIHFKGLNLGLQR